MRPMTSEDWRQVEQAFETIGRHWASNGSVDRNNPMQALAAAKDAMQRDAGPSVQKSPTAASIRSLIAKRQKRATIFGCDLFSDPAWDMLLDLTAARMEDQCLQITSLCLASGVPQTTALRAIHRMLKLGMIERFSDPNDGRRSFLRISDETFHAMLRYLTPAETGEKAGGHQWTIHHGDGAPPSVVVRSAANCG